MRAVRDTREEREIDVGCTMTSMITFTGSSTTSTASAYTRWVGGEGEKGEGVQIDVSIRCLDVL